MCQAPTHLILTIILEIVTVIIPDVQMWKVRLREVKCFAQGYRTNK